MNEHNHDLRYYRRPEVDYRLGLKSDVGHTHDDRYYTESEISSLLAGYSTTSHTHDDRYYTESEITSLLAGYSTTSHTHDDRYYTETEADARFGRLASANVWTTQNNFATPLLVTGSAGAVKDIYFVSGGHSRWVLRSNSTAESGSDVGSDFEIVSLADDGSLLGYPLFIKRSTGYVGVSTTTPYCKLDVNGTFRVIGAGAPTSGPGVEIEYNSGVGYLSGYNRTTPGYLPMVVRGSTLDLRIGSTSALYVNASRYVGIGTASPGAKLHVAGSVVIDGDEGGVAGAITLTDVSNTSLSTGTGTIKMSGSSNANSSGWIKIYIGLTSFYIPVFQAIAG